MLDEGMFATVEDARLIVFFLPGEKSHDDESFRVLGGIRDDHPKMVIASVRKQKRVPRIHGCLVSRRLSTNCSFSAFARRLSFILDKPVASSRSSSGMRFEDPADGTFFLYSGNVWVYSAIW